LTEREVPQRERGCLVAIEGIDGSGKSTQAALLARALGAVLTRAPGGTDLGRALRPLLLDQDRPLVGARAEALLMVADRAQHVEEVIEPALSSGRSVVSDRFSGSTLAYQGYGRGLDVEALASLVRWATGGLDADRYVLLDVPVEVTTARRVDASDRLEALGAAFQRRVADGFRALAAADPGRWTVVEGTGSVEAVHAAVLAAIGIQKG